MLRSIISFVKPLFYRYSYSLSGDKYKYVLYFRPTQKREGFMITLTLKDNHVIDIYYETMGFSDYTHCCSKQIAIEILSNYIKCGLNLFHNCNS